MKSVLHPSPQALGLLAVICSNLAGTLLAAETNMWQIPFGGNAYLTGQGKDSPDKVEATGVNQWKEDKSVFAIYFRADRAAVLNLVLRLKVPEGESTIRATAAGTVFEKKVTGADSQDVRIGLVNVKAPGYVRLDLQGLDKKGAVFAQVSDLIVASQTPELKLDYVKDNESNRFYWGHRGPSVHLGYVPPDGKKIEYFYNEVTVPVGQDPIGSYFMANGFGEGYFGMQANSPDQRWILFSVWSPFSTNDPKSIPEDQGVKLLAKGADVHGGEFGGEGSGGKSYLIYPWKAGTTYKFLNRVHPDGQGNTIYTAWFFPPEVGKWQLIASFQRPKTDKYLTGMHSFLENFADRNGYLGRSARYGNQWVRDTDGKWTECTKAHFTGDDVASRGYRLDYAGGVTNGGFFLRNGGFFAESVKLGSSFDRESTPSQRPQIDLDSLEAVK